MEEAREKKYLEIPQDYCSAFTSYFLMMRSLWKRFNRNSIVLKLFKISRDFGGSVSVI